jgi:hypothetical protein
VLPWVEDQLASSLDVGAGFVLAVDERPVAVTGAHGQSYRAI